MPKKKSVSKTAASTKAKKAASKLHKATLLTTSAFDPVKRMAFAEKITLAHCPNDFNANIQERLDEPFEREQICVGLNSIQGPWAESESKRGLRWLRVEPADLVDLQDGHEFMAMVYAHLIPV